MDGGQSDLGNDYATMRLLQLTSQSGGEFLPRPPPPPRRHCSTDESQRQVEHIYESPDSVRRMPAPPGCEWRPGNVPRNDHGHPAWNQQPAGGGSDVGRRYELPVTVGHDQQRFAGITSTTAGNYSL